MADAMEPLRPEAHPNYRPPIEVPCIHLEDEESGFASKRHALTTTQGGTNNSNDIVGNAEVQPFLVSDLLSPNECDQLIALVESNDAKLLQKVDWEYVQSYRDCHRAVLKCPELTTKLYQRLLPHLTTAECEHVRPYGFDTGEFGEWRPLKLNTVLRISRYDPGGHFSPHKDGAFVENDDVRSVYTVLLYLNEPPAFEGGHTMIHMPSPEDGSKEDIVRVIPRTGSALVMLHDTLHSGRAVSTGHKYICRLDIMFHRLGGGMIRAELDMIPARVEAERLYASSIVKQREGDPEGSTKDYLQAQNLQAKLPSASSSSSPTDFSKNADGNNGSLLANLNGELIMMCLRFLEPKEVCQMSLVSKWCRALCMNSLLWREFFLVRWPTLVCAESILKPDGIDDDKAIPLAIHEPPASQWRRPKRLYREVYVKTLSRPPKLYQDSREKMDRMYAYKGNYTKSLPTGYMFSSLALADFDLEARKKRKGLGLFKKKQKDSWLRRQAIVIEGAIHFQDEGDDDIPCCVPLLAETEIFFASDNYVEGRYSRLRIDACIVKIPGREKDNYLAICKGNPLTTKPNEGRYYSFDEGFRGFFDDVARVLVARQTEHALNTVAGPPRRTRNPWQFSAKPRPSNGKRHTVDAI